MHLSLNPYPVHSLLGRTDQISCW